MNSNLTIQTERTHSWVSREIHIRNVVSDVWKLQSTLLVLRLIAIVTVIKLVLLRLINMANFSFGGYVHVCSSCSSHENDFSVSFVLRQIVEKPRNEWLKRIHRNLYNFVYKTRLKLFGIMESWPVRKHSIQIHWCVSSFLAKTVTRNIFNKHAAG